MSKPVLHIVNSAFNPKGNWAIEYIARAREYENILPDVSLKFILVNDGSTRDLGNEIHLIKKEIQNFEVVNYPENQGKGYALRKGIEIGNADYYCYTDVDFPYDQYSLKKMFDLIAQSSYDIVLGKRTKAYFDAIPLQRRLISKSLIFFNKTFLRLPFPDTQAGIKIINRQAAEVFLNVSTKGFLFEVEFLKKAQERLNVGTAEVALRQNVKLNTIGMWNLFRLFKEYIKIK